MRRPSTWSRTSWRFCEFPASARPGRAALSFSCRTTETWRKPSTGSSRSECSSMSVRSAFSGNLICLYKYPDSKLKSKFEFSLYPQQLQRIFPDLPKMPEGRWHPPSAYYWPWPYKPTPSGGLDKQVSRCSKLAFSKTPLIPH